MSEGRGDRMLKYAVLIYPNCADGNEGYEDVCVKDENNSCFFQGYRYSDP